MPKLNTDFAMKIIPEFNGDRNLGQADLARDEPTLINIVKSKLSGTAYYIVKYKDFEHWADLRQQLQAEFLERRTIGQLQSELLNIRQNFTEDVKLDNNNHDYDILIPARSETIIKVKVDKNEEMVCVKQEISEGVYVGNCLINPIDNFACISILNSTESSVKLESIDLITEILDNYKADIDYERIKRVKSIIKTDHMSDGEREFILGMCTEFNDLFFLAGDRLTYTNAVTHKIPTTHSNPVHTHQYRLPHQQKLEIERQVEQILMDDIISPNTSQIFPIIRMISMNLDIRKLKRINTNIFDFPIGPISFDPPINQSIDPTSELQAQVQALNISDNLNPNLNFPEQMFL
ncbi:hypothetical protein JTB14_021139 [Gonioctena quinquepunctata]|nr:hypothetical protein JTB14_021139 [Gonioctena quinquepunctata]